MNKMIAELKMKDGRDISVFSVRNVRYNGSLLELIQLNGHTFAYPLCAIADISIEVVNDKD